MSAATHSLEAGRSFRTHEKSSRRVSLADSILKKIFFQEHSRLKARISIYYNYEQGG
ncbi:MAG: hypothetical protein FWF77_10175 [Defluviitaleaceae bacterium]|nr:hypothetical protein [Defluviitaleaceae bacterium]